MGLAVTVIVAVGGSVAVFVALGSDVFVPVGNAVAVAVGAFVSVWHASIVMSNAAMNAGKR